MQRAGRPSRGFQVERRASRAPRQPGAAVPPAETPCYTVPKSQAGNAHSDAWLAAWEDRLRLREATLAQAGVAFPRSRATPVLNLSCSRCRRCLTSLGMQEFYKGDPSVDLFSATERPGGTVEAEYDMPNEMCGCRVREFNCGCGHLLGYHMLSWCSSCASESEEDQGRLWFFYAEGVEAAPRRDEATGEALMWPGFDFQNLQESSLEESRADGGDATFFDENSVLPPENTYAEDTWGCSPLADQNGRQRVSFTKPSMEKNAALAAGEAELARKEAALRAKEDELTKREATHFEADLAHGAREKFLRDATEQHERTDAELAAREKALGAAEASLAERERQLREQAHMALGQSQGADEARRATERAHEETRRALHRAEQNAAICEAEAESLRAQLAEQQRAAKAGEGRVATQMIEIQRLQGSLAEAASAPPPQLVRRVQELEKELTTARLELQQASQDVEAKDEEIARLLPQVLRQRQQGSQHLQSRDAECERLRRELAGVRGELDAARAELLGVRPELERLRSEVLRAERSGPSAAAPDSFVQARLEVAAKLSEKRIELERREEALAAREAAVATATMPQPQAETGVANRWHSGFDNAPAEAWAPIRRFEAEASSWHGAARAPEPQPPVRQVQVPDFYGKGSGVPERPSGGLRGLAERIGLAARQSDEGRRY